MKKRERELRKSAGSISLEIKNGKCGKLKEFIQKHCDFAVNYGLMHDAAKHNNIDALKIFVDAGVPLDCDCAGYSMTPPLDFAIMYHKLEAAIFLLDSGADLESTFDDRAPTPLVSAASEGDLKMVKMLLDRGANINISYLRDGKERFNALKWAVINEHQEVADYLRSKGAVMPEEVENPDANLIPDEELITDLSKYFQCKPLPLGVMEIVQASVPLTVRIFPPVRGKRNTTVFVTSGLIEYALIVPKGKEKYWYAEYFIEMPGRWPVKDEDLAQEKYFWPIHWLKAISRYPHEQETYYDEKAIVTSEMIPLLTTPDGKYNSALVERCDDMTFRITQDERLVIYYRITPQYCDGEKK